MAPFVPALVVRLLATLAVVPAAGDRLHLLVIAVVVVLMVAGADALFALADLKGSCDQPVSVRNCTRTESVVSADAAGATSFGAVATARAERLPDGQHRRAVGEAEGLGGHLLHALQRHLRLLQARPAAVLVDGVLVNVERALRVHPQLLRAVGVDLQALLCILFRHYIHFPIPLIKWNVAADDVSYAGVIEAVARSLEQFHDLFACKHREKTMKTPLQMIFKMFQDLRSIPDIHCLQT
jgi:hypothetical protein